MNIRCIYYPFDIIIPVVVICTPVRCWWAMSKKNLRNTEVAAYVLDKTLEQTVADDLGELTEKVRAAMHFSYSFAV